MAQISFQSVSIAFGGPALLDQVDLQVQKGERIALIGRNGEGKTTLLNLAAGRLVPDSGEIVADKGLRVAGLEQDLPSDMGGTVRSVVGRQVRDDQDHKAEALMTHLRLDPEACFENLSVGFKRKVLLASALAAEPDVLLLDEPTNHLDIAAISWLETWLQTYRGTLLFVTHDRAFLDRLATRILELDRGKLSSWRCGYGTYLERREAALAVEENQRDRFMRKLAAEEAWIRQGIKARRTRNEGRVRALHLLREQQQALRSRTGQVRMRIEQARLTGKLVIEATGIRHAFGDKQVIHDFSTRIMRGDRIGIIGPNGIGKTTLLRILLGQTQPNGGTVRHGTHLEPAYFDQLRAQLDEEATVQDNIADGKEFIELNGRRRHVMGYLKDFLFTPDRCRSPVRILSGGERNRLLLARLFLKPSNVLVLDEPTNDLDMETLELLEERLLDYSGTILLVSHDRAFLNGVVTATFVFEGDGIVTEYAGGYDDWLAQRPQTEENRKPENIPAEKPRREKNRPRKLTFNETRELEALPGRIEALEAEQECLFTQMADPGFYKQPGDIISGAKDRLETVAQELEAAYARWETLENLR